jgi:hypothetical protein
MIYQLLFLVSIYGVLALLFANSLKRHWSSSTTFDDSVLVLFFSASLGLVTLAFIFTFLFLGTL